MNICESYAKTSKNYSIQIDRLHLQTVTDSLWTMHSLSRPVLSTPQGVRQASGRARGWEKGGALTHAILGLFSYSVLPPQTGHPTGAPYSFARRRMVRPSSGFQRPRPTEAHGSRCKRTLRPSRPWVARREVGGLGFHVGTWSGLVGGPRRTSGVPWGVPVPGRP